MINRIMLIIKDPSFYKFIVVGVANTVLGTAIMFILYNVFNCGYYFSSFCNYFFGSILSYFLNKYFTFNYKKKSLKIVFKFIVNISICYLISYCLAKKIVEVVIFFLPEKVIGNISLLVGMGLFVICNYFGQKKFVFNSNDCH